MSLCSGAAMIDPRTMRDRVDSTLSIDAVRFFRDQSKSFTVSRGRFCNCTPAPLHRPVEAPWYMRLPRTRPSFDTRSSMAWNFLTLLLPASSRISSTRRTSSGIAPDFKRFSTAFLLRLSSSPSRTPKPLDSSHCRSFPTFVAAVTAPSVISLSSLFSSSCASDATCTA